MNHLSRFILLSSGLMALIGLRCATAIPPRELIDARAEFDKASHGPTAEVNPKGLYEAKKSLDSANASFVQDATGEDTRDLSYIALRKVQLAEAQAGTELANRQKTKADQDIQTTTTTQLTEAKKQLSESEKAREGDKEHLARNTEELEKANLDLAAEKQKSENALATLAKFAMVKHEDRGTVITLSGSVMFASGQAALLSNARPKLDEVAAALKQSEGQFVVEGHTDSVGSDSLNQDLSVRRAQSVRDYLVDRGVPSEKIKAVGYGKGRPVTENNTAEGRANNRRVEIVIQGRQVAAIN